MKTVGPFLEVGQELAGGDRAGGGAERLRQLENVVAEEDAALELAATHVGEEHQEIACGSRDASIAGRFHFVREPHDRLHRLKNHRRWRVGAKGGLSCLVDVEVE